MNQEYSGLNYGQTKALGSVGDPTLDRRAETKQSGHLSKVARGTPVQLIQFNSVRRTEPVFVSATN
jgi:hypothetical protein